MSSFISFKCGETCPATLCFGVCMAQPLKKEGFLLLLMDIYTLGPCLCVDEILWFSSSSAGFAVISSVSDQRGTKVLTMRVAMG